MYCKYCGRELPSDAKFCPNCGARIEPERIEISTFQPIPFESYNPSSTSTPIESEPKAFSILAIISLVCGILTSIFVFGASVMIFGSAGTNTANMRSYLIDIRSFLFIIIVFISIPGIVFGAIGKKSKNHKGKANTGKVLSLVFSIIGSIIWTLLLGY